MAVDLLGSHETARAQPVSISSAVVALGIEVTCRWRVSERLISYPLERSRGYHPKLHDPLTLSGLGKSLLVFDPRSWDARMISAGLVEWSAPDR